MHSAPFLILRTVTVVLFVLAPPLIALPPVGSALDRLWNGWTGDRAADQSADEQPVAAKQPQLEPAPRWTALNPVDDSVRIDSVGIEPGAAYAGDVRPVSQFDPAAAQYQKGPPTQIQLVAHRLHELGAISTTLETKLETTAGSPPCFHFRCQVPVNDSVYIRVFECSNHDPLVAMENVLSQIQAWYLACEPAELTSATVRRR